MSKVPSTDLFDLIKSMTKGEKRGFKLYATRHAIGGKNKYVELFDAIDRQDVYDERRLIDGNPSLRGIDLRSMKPYLHDLILRSLRDTLRERSSTAKVQYQIDKAEILMYKGLHAQATRLLARVAEVARERNHLIKLLDILFYQSTLKVWVEEMNSLDRHLDLYHQKIDLLEKLRNNLEYYHLFMQVFYLQRETFDPRNAGERGKLEDILGSPFLAPGVEPLTLFGKLTRLEAQVRCCQLLGDSEGELRCTEEKLALFDANPDYRELHWYEYVFACETMLWNYTYFHRYDEFDALMIRMKRLRDERIDAQVYLELNIHRSELLHAGQRCRFDAARHKVTETLRFLEKHHAEIEVSAIIQLRISFLILAIKIADHRSALRWLGELVNDRQFHGYPRFVELTKMLAIVLYYDIGEEEGVESAVRSFYRFLKKKDKIGEFENIMIPFLRRLPLISGRSELRTAFQMLHDRLRHTWDTPEGKIRLFQFDFLTWLESKIAGRPFAEMLAEKEGVRF